MNFPSCSEALRALLNRVDYVEYPGSCAKTDPIGLRVDPELIGLCRLALAHLPGAAERALAVTTRGLMALVITFEARGIPPVAVFRSAVETILHDAMIAAGKPE